MSDVLRLVALNAGIAGVGALAVVTLGLRGSRTLVPTIAGLAPAVGLALVGLAATVGAMLGVDVTPAAAAILASLVLLGLLLVARGRSTAPRLRPVGSGLAGRAVEAIALVLLAGLSLTMLRYAAATALDQWDGWAVWGVKAQALYVAGDVWSPVFTEPEYVMHQQGYPVLLPALEALSAGALGRFDPD